MVTKRTIPQIVFKTGCPRIHLLDLHETNLSSRILNDFLSDHSGAIGLSAMFGSKCSLTTLALSNGTQTLVLRLSGSKHRTAGRELLASGVLCSTTIEKVAFDMDRVATSLHLDHNLHIAGAIDVQSLHKHEGSRGSIDTLMKALGGEVGVNRDAALQVFLHSKANDIDKCAIRAWCSWKLSTSAAYAFDRTKTRAIDTLSLDEFHLGLLSKFVRIMDRLVAMKPTKVKNDVSQDALFKPHSGEAALKLTRFKTRTRRSDNQILLIEFKGTSVSSAQGRVVKVKGKSTTVKVNKGFIPTSTFDVYTIGKDDPTSAEKERISIILSTLQQITDVIEEPFAQHIYYGCVDHPSSAVSLRGPRSGCHSSVTRTIVWPGRPLNPSQTTAIDGILSDRPEDKVCLVQGPPGTGKTTVIAACVLNAITDPSSVAYQGVWLVAQSNVAVKNIAEKLADIGFWDFKLLVSHDFHFDWHEHLYHEIESNVIRSDGFGEDKTTNARKLNGSRVILCTLSMFCHWRLVPGGFTSLVPVEMVIVDEASQIEIGDYLPLLHKFGSTLRKLAFIGDNKQLAPYGQDNIGDLQSVFELKHLRRRAVFLDTQYRMPQPIGDFISRRVYNGRLKTVHKIQSKRSCRLVDVHHGREVSGGNSWRNPEEVQAVMHIATKFHVEGKEFKIITPYDAQRNALESALKSSTVPWEDKCFNVDSFQGNEEDHIIISVVRSAKVGFPQQPQKVQRYAVSLQEKHDYLHKSRISGGDSVGYAFGQVGEGVGKERLGFLS